MFSRRVAVALLAAPALLLPVTGLGQGSGSGVTGARVETTATPGRVAGARPVPEPGTYALPALGEAGDGAVIDSRGRPVRLRALLSGRIALLSFIYLNCADADGCPLATAVLVRVSRRLSADPALRGQVRLLSLSFDPVRDTPAAMRSQAALLRIGGVDWRFLTTESREALEPILDAYGQSVVQEPGPAGGGSGAFAHLLRVFLIDPEGRVRNVYSTGFLDAATLMADIHTLRMEPRRTPRHRSSARSSAGGGPRVDLLALYRSPPRGLPSVPTPTDNALTPAKVRLGRKLFFDRRLSLNDTMSCAMCHIPEQGFASNELATAVGIEGRTVRRNAPTVLNVGYMERLFHDGRETSLEQQVWGPLLARNEMGNPSVGVVIDKLRRFGDYAGLFEAAFDGRGPGMETVGMALASYQRTLLAGNSPFDRWRYGGETDAVDEAVRRGYRLFTGRAGCAACHSVGEEHALFTDHRLHNTGIGARAALEATPAVYSVQVAPGVRLKVDADAVAESAERPPGDVGLYEITLSPADRWKYRTPSLRNVALTGPYMHDGSLATLEAVVRYYDRGGYAHPLLDERIRPLGLSAREVADLVALLRSLTGANLSALGADARLEPVGDPGVARFPRYPSLSPPSKDR